MLSPLLRRVQDAWSAAKENQTPPSRAVKRRRVSGKVPVPASTLHTAPLNCRSTAAPCKAVRCHAAAASGDAACSSPSALQP